MELKFPPRKASPQPVLALAPAPSRPVVAPRSGGLPSAETTLGALPLFGRRPAAPAARWLVVHLPAFRLERCGYSAEQVAVLIAEQRSAVRLVSITPAAFARGLRPGQTATEARALIPDLILEPYDPVAEQLDREAMLAPFDRLSDGVRWLDDDLVLAIHHTAHLFGGERGILEETQNVLSQFGLCHRLVIADDPLGARALARHLTEIDSLIVPPHGNAEALVSLPLATLRPGPLGGAAGPFDTLLAGLREVGIQAIGAFAKLTPSAVAARYGALGVGLHTISRGGSPPDLWALCGALAPTVGGDDLVTAAASLGGPTHTLEPLFFLLPGLLTQLCCDLTSADLLAVRLAVRLDLDGGRLHVVRVRVGRPTADVKRLTQLVRARLEALKLEAPAVGLALVVEESSPTRGWQPGLLDRAEASELLPDLLARLTDTLGEKHVFGAELVANWRPERAWRARAFEDETEVPLQPRDLIPPLLSPRGRLDPVLIQDHWDYELARSRPSLLLPQPQRIEVREQNDRPAFLRVPGGWEAIRRVAGPEVLSGEWWEADGGFEREYWVIDVGPQIWLFRDRSNGSWFLHGWFD